MAVDEFLATYYNKFAQPAPDVMSARNNSIRPFKVKSTPPVDQNKNSQVDLGSIFQKNLGQSVGNADQRYADQKSQINLDIAKTIAPMSAGNVPVDEYGIVQKNFKSPLTNAKTNLDAISQRGEIAAQGEEAKAQFQLMKKLQDLSQFNVSTVFGSSYDPKLIAPGASQNNPGAQALAIAMTALQNHTPYVWGGNSLQKGVDCSGLVQQAYAQIGIPLPRQTYQQAKSGQVVSVANALPGDLVFYNTGSRDPNGIGKYGHVGIYMGNGQILEAANSRSGIRISSINGFNGSPSLVVRPWS